MNYKQLEDAVKAVIKENGNEEITGEILQAVLLTMIRSLGTGYQFMGVATSETEPGTPDQKVFYLFYAQEETELANFGLTVGAGLSVILWGTEWTAQTIEIGGGVESLIVPTTWADLKALRDAGELIPGMRYRITDYVATTAQAGTRSANHPFDIIVVADSANTLNENATAIQHGGDTYFANSNLAAWKLKYCLDNDATRFDWADGENGKGVIYYLEDEFANKVGFDFKGIQFKRYQVLRSNMVYDEAYVSQEKAELYASRLAENSSAPRHQLYGFDYEKYDGSDFSDYFEEPSATIDDDAKYILIDDPYYMGDPYVVCKIDESLSDWFYLFNSATAEVDLSIRGKVNNILNNDFSKTNGLIFSVFFGSSCIGNTLGDDCYNNTFGSNCIGNTLGDDCYGNTFGTSFSNNILGNGCYGNTFADNCNNNTFKGICYYNSFRRNCSYNTFGNKCYYNFLGFDCSYNTFGDDFSTNIFGENCSHNTFGDACSDIIFGNACINNIFGESCLSITFETPNTVRYCTVCSNTTNKVIPFVANEEYLQIASVDTDGDLVIQIPPHGRVVKVALNHTYVLTTLGSGFAKDIQKSDSIIIGGDIYPKLDLFSIKDSSAMSSLITDAADYLDEGAQGILAVYGSIRWSIADDDFDVPSKIIAVFYEATASGYNLVAVKWDM